MALRFGLDPVLPAYLYLAAVGLALALIDLDCKRLPGRPDAAQLPRGGRAAGRRGPARAATAASCCGRSSGGAGDVRGCTSRSASPTRPAWASATSSSPACSGMYLGWLGWGAWAVGLFLGFFLGGRLRDRRSSLAKKGGRKTAVPFGPFMLLGVLIAVLVGPELASGYADLTGALDRTAHSSSLFVLKPSASTGRCVLDTEGKALRTSAAGTAAA